jgi:phosphatidate cytidylyltransferase
MLKYRLIFGPLMIAVAVGLVVADMRLDALVLTGTWQSLFLGRDYLPQGLILTALVLILIPIAAVELARMLESVGVSGHRWIIAVGGIAGCMAVYSTPRILTAPTGATIIATVLVATFILTLLWHSRDASTKGVIAAAGATMFGIALLGMMPGFYLAIRRWHSAWVVVGIILITKSGDIGAYFTGRAIGKHKLIPWLSPKKTWEGLAGAVVLATIVAVFFAWLSQVTSVTHTYQVDALTGARRLQPVEYHMGWAAVAGVLFALVGHAGDLMMSMFKRDAGIKDSGRAIPGFGGLLDVLDSPLLVAPIAYWLLELAKRM